MKRPILWTTTNGVELPYPKHSDWNIQQLNTRFALQSFFSHTPFHIRDYISFHYGEFQYVIDFSKFYFSYWEISGRYFDQNDMFDSIDKKFISWLDIMDISSLCPIVALDFDRVFKKFKYH